MILSCFRDEVHRWGDPADYRAHHAASSPLSCRNILSSFITTESNKQKMQEKKLIFLASCKPLSKGTGSWSRPGIQCRDPRIRIHLKMWWIRNCFIIISSEVKWREGSFCFYSWGFQTNMIFLNSILWRFYKICHWNIKRLWKSTICPNYLTSTIYRFLFYKFSSN